MLPSTTQGTGTCTSHCSTASGAVSVGTYGTCMYRYSSISTRCAVDPLALPAKHFLLADGEYRALGPGPESWGQALKALKQHGFGACTCCRDGGFNESPHDRPKSSQWSQMDMSYVLRPERCRLDLVLRMRAHAAVPITVDRQKRSSKIDFRCT